MTTLSEIKIENLKSFENNPFIFREDTAFEMLIESIANLGVLTPIIVILQILTVRQMKCTSF